MDFIKLESERLWFREYRMEDFYVFYDMLSNIENIKYRSSEPKNEDDVHGYIEWGINCANQKPCINYRYAVVLKDTGETIGSCELAFTDTLWPDFTPDEFEEMVAAFGSRKRRFGGR